MTSRENDLLSHAELFQSPTRYEGEERNVTLPAKYEEAHDFVRSQQANRRSRKQLFQITFGISKQSWSETYFIGRRHQRLHCGPKASKPRKKTKIRYQCFLSRVYRVSWEKLAKPEKWQTYLVCIRINCSVVSTSVLFEETKLSKNKMNSSSR